MLLKRNRVSARVLKEIFQKGKFINSSHLTLKFILESTGLTCGNSHRSDLGKENPRISFIVSKNVAKLAVKRNLLRRRGYTALRKQLNQFPLGLVGVFIFKRYQDNVSVIENEIKNILTKIN